MLKNNRNGELYIDIYVQANVNIGGISWTVDNTAEEIIDSNPNMNILL